MTEPKLTHRELLELEVKIMKRMERALAELPNEPSKRRVAAHLLSLTALDGPTPFHGFENIPPPTRE